MSDLIDIEKNEIVKKHQDLIRNARYSLSEMGIKIVSCLIAMVRVGDKDFQEYHLKISDFKELIGSTSRDTYQQVHATAKELISKSLKVGDEQFSWCYYARYTENDATVVLKIAPELKPYLLELKEGNFTQYFLENIMKLKSSYVIRLYELFIDLWKEHSRYKKSSLIFDLSIDDLRKKFEIPESYQYSSHIKKLIIDKAKKQFKEKTDIQFSYREQKVGKRVDRLIITLQGNEKGSSDYMKDEKSFVAYMRKNFVNQDILFAKDTKTGENYNLSVSQKGVLYAKEGQDFTAQRAKEMWGKLYALAKEDKLLCLKQGRLF